MRVHQHGGFTLIELMIVVAIIAILAAIAYPSYESQALKSRRAEGKAFLMQVMQAEERHFTENYTYTTDLINDLNYTFNPARSENDLYRVSAAACAGSTIAQCVVLTATPRGAQANDTICANLTLNSIGTKGISGTGNVAGCW